MVKPNEHNDDDAFLFNEHDDTPTQKPLDPEAKYNLLIVDDEPDVHEVTKLALRRYTFNGAGLNILSAFSGEEAINLLQDRDDIAVILLDVVMERDDAGLKVANWIRRIKGDHRVRIVLRTGQPGEAPEERIMTEYDINDYKEKGELTNRKLNTLMHACLRAYNDIVTIEDTCRKLTDIVRSDRNHYSLRPVEAYSNGIIRLLMDLMTYSRSYLCASYGNEEPDQALITYASGHYSNHKGCKISEITDVKRFSPLLAHHETGYIEDNNQFLGYIANGTSNYLIILDEIEHNDKQDANIVELFLHHIALCYHKERESL
ncbi:DUF3369 domain-containing protein [Thalassomonas viridans]|uniref:DUF3369 domain-containing protein n=1 Tax=Thalassomonas viridans TaxID=137584 RepID=A0AAE9Z7P8_9GAMM|nr:DUF3369 domain-containing protein [Thalassomonas viridans]WDE06833.1 DUF3369 domain-containing protein [Thalassomonas viridans]